MKTDIQTANEAVTPNSRELTLLKKYFPQCFSKPDTDENGNIIKENFDIEKLTELLNKDEVNIKKEGFTLNFLGKSYAHFQSNLDSETVIVPDEKNAETDSENVYIVGDNLDALQHLKYSYAEKIKCIYIDPPYNTGKDDFVYNDKFGFTAKELVEKLDVSEEEAERICGMNGKCTHSAWLTFMYPRLALARELLREDGVIFISIDDNEQANLKRLCDEVFGEGNFVGNIVVKSNPRGSMSEAEIADLHEYLLIYAKDRPKVHIIGHEISEEMESEYKLSDNKGLYRLLGLRMRGGFWRRSDRPSLFFPIYINPNTCEVSLESSSTFSEKTYPIQPSTNEEGTWRWSKEKIQQDKNLLIGKKIKRNDKEVWDIYQKDYLVREEGRRTKAKSIWEENEINYQNGTIIVKELLGKSGIFDYSKPVFLVEQAIRLLSTEENDIILDFFSGSGTTAHAVMDLNANDTGNRKFIMVQLDEPVKKDSEAEKAGYKTIDEIGRERIRRAAAKLKAEHPDTSADLGFKTYYLKSMPKETLDKIKTFDPNALISSDGDIVKSLGEKTLLQTWQIKDGFGFNAVPQKIDLSGYTAYLLDDEKIGKYLYLLGEIEEKSIKELIRKIESLELTVDKIFIYGYSFDFNMLTSITTNLKTLKNRNPLEPIVRY